MMITNELYIYCSAFLLQIYLLVVINYIQLYPILFYNRKSFLCWLHLFFDLTQSHHVFIDLTQFISLASIMRRGA